VSQLNYDLEISWEPEQLRAGQTVTITVKVNNPQGEVSSMHLSIPEEGFYESLRRAGDNVFALTGQVPWEASGIYPVRFYARDASGNKGPETVVQVRVA